MKKLFLSVLAIAGLVACVQEEVLTSAPNLNDGTAIAFGDAIVDNSVRAEINDPSFTNESLQEFTVWAYVDESKGLVLKDEKVYKNPSWTYDNTQYWVKGHNYRFFAVAPRHSANVAIAALQEDGNLNNDPHVNGLGNITFTNVNGTEDLLYASLSKSTAQSIPDKVQFQFDHILSKVKFSFTNGFEAANYSVVVTDVKMYVPKEATINLNAQGDYTSADHKWVLADGETTELSFGHIDEGKNVAKNEKAYTDNERLTIPASADQKYKVTFKVELWSGEIKLSEANKTTYIEGCELLPGHAYNFTATLNAKNVSADGDEEGLQAIVFEAGVKDWDEGGEYDGGIIATNMVANETELAEALAKGGLVTLANDLALTENTSYLVNTVTRATERNVATLDLNGFKLTATSSTTGKNFNLFDVRGTLTVKNGTIEYTHVGENMGWGSSINVFNVTAGGVLNLESVTVKTIGGSDMGFVAHLNNWGEVTLNVENSTLESNYVAVRVFNSGYDMNNVTIKNSTLKGGSYAFWVHNYTVADFGTEAKAESQKALLNFDIFNGTNTFVGKNSSPIRYGFTNAEYRDANNSLYVDSAETLAAALSANKKVIDVVLGADIDCPISTLGVLGSGDVHQLGGAETESIAINLNGHKLNLTTSYWSFIGALNNNATITIKNGTMTSGQATGTWNSYDLGLASCNYVIDNVVFDKSIALSAANKNYTLKNVTINETHDYYAMWIEAIGQNVTIDGLTVVSDGRGIKIDEQYVENPEKVTLNIKNATFTTAKKAAILVKSAAGAEINAENLDIANVAEDKDFAVWVDEDAAAHAAKVVVNGALVKVEGQIVNITEVSTVEGLKDALVAAGSAGAGNSVIELAAGEYTMSNWTPITVDGYHGADIVTINGNGAVLKGMTTSLFDGGFAGGSGIVIKNLTIDGAAIVANKTQGYGAFVNCADSMAEITLINCHLINSSIITPNDGANESRIGGLVGWTSGYSNTNDGPVKTYVNIKDCSVVGCTLKGFGSIGGICGHAGASDWTYTTIENCTVKNNNLVSTDDGSWRVGVAVGTANVGEVVVKNLTESGNTLTQGSLVAPTGVRSYAGRLALGTTGSFVVDGVAITK